jgi:hypothetical protein
MISVLFRPQVGLNQESAPPSWIFFQSIGHRLIQAVGAGKSKSDIGYKSSTGSRSNKNSLFVCPELLSTYGL